MWRNCLDLVASNARTIDGSLKYPHGFSDKGPGCETDLPSSVGHGHGCASKLARVSGWYFFHRCTRAKVSARKETEMLAKNAAG